MNDLDAVRALARLAPQPSAAVLAAALTTAGLSGTPDAPVLNPDSDAEPIVLMPRRPRRHRRRMVSLTVALASTGVAAAVVGALLVSGAARPVSTTSPGAQPASGAAAEPSGLTFPTDAQLAAAMWFHVRTDADKGATCTGSRDAWFATSGRGSFERQPGQGATQCALGDESLDAPYNEYRYYLGDGPPMSYAELQKFSISEPDLEKRMRKDAETGGNNPAEEYTVVLSDALRETPMPSRLRHQLVDLLAAAPHVVSVNGVDSLGRPVRWLSLSTEPTDRRGWWGVDELQDWLIAESSGAAGTDGGPAQPGYAVIAIDTTAPTPLSQASPPLASPSTSPSTSPPSPGLSSTPSATEATPSDAPSPMFTATVSTPVPTSVTEPPVSPSP